MDRETKKNVAHCLAIDECFLQFYGPHVNFGHLPREKETVKTNMKLDI